MKTTHTVLQRKHKLFLVDKRILCSNNLKLNLKTYKSKSKILPQFKVSIIREIRKVLKISDR